jgi:hypothetical protein
MEDKSSGVSANVTLVQRPGE